MLKMKLVDGGLIVYCRLMVRWMWIMGFIVKKKEEG